MPKMHETHGYRGFTLMWQHLSKCWDIVSPSQLHMAKASTLQAARNKVDKYLKGRKEKYLKGRRK